MKTLCIFSDSIGVGQGVSPHKSWVHLLSEYLKDWYVINASRNGDTTRLALERMRFDVLSHRPNVVYIQFGMNDANVWADANGIPRVTLFAFRFNLLEMVRRCEAIGSEVILATNNGIRVGGMPDYNYQIESLAKLCEVKLVKHEYKEPTLLQDGVHLSERGHQLYFEKIRGLF